MRAHLILLDLVILIIFGEENFKGHRQILHDWVMADHATDN
jgi:hypothetical protein